MFYFNIAVLKLPTTLFEDSPPYSHISNSYFEPMKTFIGNKEALRCNMNHMILYYLEFRVEKFNCSLYPCSPRYGLKRELSFPLNRQ